MSSNFTKEYAPIVLFVYKRLEHTISSVEALKKNELAPESDLFVFSDGNRDDADRKAVEKVRNYISKITGFRNVKIINSPQNKGLANSVITGVTEVINQYRRVIVLEDDLVTSKDFLKFMNDALNFYKSLENIYSVTGYSLPIKVEKSYKYRSYLIPTRSSSWGWGTWKRAWDHVDWDLKDSDTFFSTKAKVKEFNRFGNDMTAMLKNQLTGKIDSWSIRFDYHHYKYNALCAYPIKAKVQNNGMDGTGEHSRSSHFFDVQLDDRSNDTADFALAPDQAIMERFGKFYKQSLSYKMKLIYKFNDMFRKK